MKSLPCLLVAAAAVFSLAGCRCGPSPVDVDGSTPLDDGGRLSSGRCDIPLDSFVQPTGTASVRQVVSSADLIGGPTAYGKPGDFRLDNEKARFIVQGFDRHIGAQPYGATILDADLLRGGGPGKDQFGETGLLYNFGRTVDPEKFEILRDGSQGGSVVLAATGHDAANDYLSIRNQLRDQLGSLPRVDPYKDLPLTITNYFILNPGEQRLRFVTAFCNDDQASLSLAVGDLTDPGYSLDYFNGQSCTNGFGFGGVCFGLDRMSWFGYQGEGVAYGYAPWNTSNPAIPEPQNALLTVAGITGSVLGAPGITGIAEWFGDGGTPSSELRVPGLSSRYIVRDFYVANDLGELSTLIQNDRAAATGDTLVHFSGTVRDNGAPLANARVTFRTPAEVVAVFLTDDAGHYQGDLPSQSYQVQAWASGRAPTAAKSIALTAPQTIDFDLTGTRALVVNVKDAATGTPIPAKVTVQCTGGACPTPNSALNIFTDTVHDPLLQSEQLIDYVGATGTATFNLPPAQYQVLVSRGPEWSIFPNDYPTGSSGYPVDLRTSAAVVNASLAHVLDTTGWQSADFHVHAVNSPDSTVVNDDRVLTFAGDGLDVIVSTDHDYITDYRPTILKLGMDPFLTTMIGEEVSTMDFGHYNFFPLTPVPEDPITAGALDWAGGRDATLNPRMIFAAGRTMGAKTVHFNHPRGVLGGFTHLRVDTDTLATHADPRDFRMDTPPGSTPADTLLMNTDFNALEVLNAGEDQFDINDVHGRVNDWFTLLSRGITIAATGVSDTHRKHVASGWRTWVNTGVDSPAQFSPDVMTTKLNALKALASNGPFVKIDAKRINSANTITSLSAGPGDTLSRSTDDVLVTVDVQVPEYLDVTRIELYMHKAQDDDSCPRDSTSPNAATTRVACDGEMNQNWPASGITASTDIALAAGDLVTVGTFSGTAYHRWHVTRTFRMPAPTTDNWIVAFVYGSKQLFPLLYRPVTPNKPTISITPFALTNPIFVDADGNGYDHAPFHPPTRPMAGPYRPPPQLAPPKTTAEFVSRWGTWVTAQ